MEKMINKEDAASFQQSIRTAAQLWHERPPALSARAGSQDAYDEMADQLFDGMCMSGLSDRFRLSTAAIAGFNVTTRFLYAGAAKAAAKNFSLEQLKRATFAPGSFTQLQLLTREYNSAASDIELELGLKRSSYYSVDQKLGEFSIEEERGIRIPFYAMHQLNARRRLAYEGRISEDEAFSENPEKDPVRCLGHTAGLLAYTYKYMAEISLSDRQLAAAKLEASSTADHTTVH